MENTVTGAFICPIHNVKDHFRYGLELYQSALKYHLEQNFYFVFSDDDQKKQFEKLCVGINTIKPQGLIYEIPQGHKCPVTAKKYYALFVLKEQYDYLATVDCESVFLREFNPGIVFDEIWKSGSNLASNHVHGLGKEVINSCVASLHLESDEALRKETHDFSFYWWFNEIPVYKSSGLGGFFRWIDQNGYINAICNNFYCFDYLIYGMWLIIEKRKHIKKISGTHDGGVVERFGIYERDRLMSDKKIRNMERKIGTHWTSRRSIILENESIVMRMQRDSSLGDSPRLNGMGLLRHICKKVYYSCM